MRHDHTSALQPLRTRSRTPGFGPQTRLLAEIQDASPERKEAAFAELYDLTSHRIHSVVLKVLQSPDHAVEVTQEVYLDIWQQIGRFSARRGNAMSWMVTIARRRAVDRVRSSASENARDTRWSRLDTATPYDQVWDAVEHRIDADRVRSGLIALTTMQREAVLLAYFGGYTHCEVAAELGVPLGTVKARIRTSLSILRGAVPVE